jgi:hypothetical protein
MHRGRSRDSPSYDSPAFTRDQQVTGTASSAPFMVIEGVLFVVGAFLAFQGLRRSG